MTCAYRITFSQITIFAPFGTANDNNNRNMANNNIREYNGVSYHVFHGGPKRGDSNPRKHKTTGGTPQNTFIHISL